MKVLVACEYSGRVRDAFKAKGHDAISCDLLPTEVEGKHYKVREDKKEEFFKENPDFKVKKKRKTRKKTK